MKGGSTDASAKLPRGIALNATFPFWMNMCSLKVTKIQRTRRSDGGDMCGWFAWGYTERQKCWIFFENIYNDTHSFIIFAHTPTGRCWICWPHKFSSHRLWVSCNVPIVWLSIFKMYRCLYVQPCPQHDSTGIVPYDVTTIWLLYHVSINMYHQPSKWCLGTPPYHPCTPWTDPGMHRCIPTMFLSWN